MAARATAATKRATMVRGPKKHMKRLNAPSHWMLDKLGGIFVSAFELVGAASGQGSGVRPWRACRRPPAGVEAAVQRT